VDVADRVIAIVEVEGQAIADEYTIELDANAIGEIRDTGLRYIEGVGVEPSS
jgi:hypothetical protein